MNNKCIKIASRCSFHQYRRMYMDVIHTYSLSSSKRKESKKNKIMYISFFRKLFICSCIQQRVQKCLYVYVPCERLLHRFVQHARACLLYSYLHISERKSTKNNKKENKQQILLCERTRRKNKSNCFSMFMLLWFISRDF